jgi:hypothetical protein
MKIKNILLVAIVCITYTNSRAQKDSTIQAAKDLCSCLDEVENKKHTLEKIISTAKEKKIAEIDNHIKELQILKDLFGCMNKLTKDELWQIENNKSMIYEYVKANCNKYEGLIIFNEMTTQNNKTVDKIKFENKKSAKDFRLMAFDAFDKDDMFFIREYCSKAIELDSTNTEKDIITEHFFKIAQDWVQSAVKFEKEGKISYARAYRSDAHLPLIFALEFGGENRDDIGKVIYNNLIMLHDEVGANLYIRYK